MPAVAGSRRHRRRPPRRRRRRRRDAASARLSGEVCSTAAGTRAPTDSVVRVRERARFAGGERRPAGAPVPEAIALRAASRVRRAAGAAPARGRRGGGRPLPEWGRRRFVGGGRGPAGSAAAEAIALRPQAARAASRNRGTAGARRPVPTAVPDRRCGRTRGRGVRVAVPGGVPAAIPGTATVAARSSTGSSRIQHVRRARAEPTPGAALSGVPSPPGGVATPSRRLDVSPWRTVVPFVAGSDEADVLVVRPHVAAAVVVAAGIGE